jgi:ATP-dependent protease HslVU (ClpYQ) peptidase subunit
MPAMSIVVAVHKNDRTVVAADTLASFGDAERVPPANASVHKVLRIGDAVVGGTGWAVYDDILRDFLSRHPAPSLTGEGEIFSFFMQLWKALHDEYSFVNDQAPGKDTPFGDLDSSFLIASSGGIFKVSSDMGITRFNQYYAIGCASDYALGAMYNLYPVEADPESIARRAVETAIAFDMHCGGEVEVLEVTGAPEAP